MGNLRKKVLTGLKIAFSLVLLYLVFQQIPFREVWATVRTSHPGYLALAVFLFVTSKAAASIRLNRYFHQIGIPLTEAANLKLYLLGMFYNLFLPGGIGGDAYKGYVLRREFTKPVKRLAGVLLLDRISGLFVLVVLSGLLLSILRPDPLAPYLWAIPAVLLLGFAIYYFIHRRFFGYVQQVFWKALGYSVLVQVGQLIAAFLILRALGVEQITAPYLLLFLISGMVAVLPITIGGVGSRELVFYYGALWWGLEEPKAIALSLLFFGITAMVSLAGIGYHFRKPELELTDEIREAG